jgi:hypothetical protein
MRKIRSQRLDFSCLFSHAFAPHLVWAVGLNLLLWAAQVSAGQVTLRWDAVNGASGYRVYYGQTSGSYTSQVNVVGQTQTTSPPVSITNGLIYFFAVKAYNSTGQESPFSNEVRVAPPRGRLQCQCDQWDGALVSNVHRSIHGHYHGAELELRRWYQLYGYPGEPYL